MNEYTIIGIDLAKTKFHLAALNEQNKVVMKESIARDNFISTLGDRFSPGQVFAFEACGGAHNIGQILIKAGYEVIALKPKDVKAYAKSRQKNDTNDAIAICKAALDPGLKHVRLKSQEEQKIAFLHKMRQNAIRQRIQRSNALMTSLQEFGYVVTIGKSKFAIRCAELVNKAQELGYIDEAIKKEMQKDCEEINHLLVREDELDQSIKLKNKESDKARALETIPGIGTINASVLSIKAADSYESAKDFAASLGLVPKQSTTGGRIQLGGITKQGDRYARTMLIQGARSVVMRSCKANVPEGDIYEFISRLKKKKKKFNVICVAVANKLARIVYALLTKGEIYNAHGLAGK